MLTHPNKKIGKLHWERNVRCSRERERHTHDNTHPGFSFSFLSLSFDEAYCYDNFSPLFIFLREIPLLSSPSPRTFRPPAYCNYFPLRTTLTLSLSHARTHSHVYTLLRCRWSGIMPANVSVTVHPPSPPAPSPPAPESQPGFDDSAWLVVDAPHDMLINQECVQCGQIITVIQIRLCLPRARS